MQIRSKVGLTAAAAGLLAAAMLGTGPARASISSAETRSVTLRYDPRDLNTDQGAERLLARVSGAASRVCDEGGSVLQLIEASSYRVCRHDAIARAVADINRPMVTAAYTRHFADKEKGLRAAAGPQPAVALRLLASE